MRRPPESRRPAATGFSLVEVLVAMALMGLVMAGVFGLAATALETVAERNRNTAVRQEARISLYRIASELRLAGYGLGDIPEGLMQASPDRITFAGDVDLGSDGTPCARESQFPDGGAERISYRTNKDTIERSVDCWDGKRWLVESAYSPMARADQTGSPLFRYFDRTGIEMAPGPAGLTALQRATVVRVAVTVRITDPDRSLRIDGGPLPIVELRLNVRLHNQNAFPGMLDGRCSEEASGSTAGDEDDSRSGDEDDDSKSGETAGAGEPWTGCDTD